MKDATAAHADAHAIDVAAHTMLRAGQDLLALIAELKQMVLLYDFESVGAGTATRLRALQAQQQAGLQALAALRPLVGDLRAASEDAYQAASCR